MVEGGGFGLLSFRGQSTLLNNVTFDGADDNQAFFSEERGRTRAGYSTAKASIQEFQVNTSNYSVEYGRSAGGVVNAVTRAEAISSTARLYFFDRDAEWGAKNPFNDASVQTGDRRSLTLRRRSSSRRIGASSTASAIGGPIIKDKVFFFFAFDRFTAELPGHQRAIYRRHIFYTLPDADAAKRDRVCELGIDGAGSGSVPAGGESLHGADLGGERRDEADLAGDEAQYAAASTLTPADRRLNSMTGTTARTGDQDIFFPKIDWQINGKNHADG